MIKTTFAFDLDGTVTAIETLPLLAGELGLAATMKRLTDLTLSGAIDFESSFRLRHSILCNISIERIREIMSTVPLNEAIVDFIRSRRDDCVIVTGNLDRWIEPLSARIGCKFFSSTIIGGQLTVIDKGATIRQLKKAADRVISIGESFNDISMMSAADISIAYGGVHRPVEETISIADYVVFDGETLCRLLKTL